jgi:DNA-binding MarR family transcriptional regulator
MTQARATLDEQVATVRGFNRFYTRQIGLLDEGLLESEFSLTEARVLYELAHHDGLTATDLGRDLGLDAGYLSRILKKFTARGLLTRAPSGRDARQSILALTAAGRAAFLPLKKASQDKIAELLGPLSADDRVKLVKAMGVIGRLWGGAPAPRVPYILRPHQPGDLGWVTHRQAVLYNREYGWDETFEALVAEILAGFVKTFDAKRERCWIAEREDEIVGSVFVCRTGRARPRHRPPPRRRMHPLRPRQGLRHADPVDQRHPPRRPPHLRGRRFRTGRRGAPSLFRQGSRRPALEPGIISRWRIRLVVDGTTTAARQGGAMSVAFHGKVDAVEAFTFIAA